MELYREYEAAYMEEKWNFELTETLANFSKEVAGRTAAIEVMN